MGGGCWRCAIRDAQGKRQGNPHDRAAIAVEPRNHAGAGAGRVRGRLRGVRRRIAIGVCALLPLAALPLLTRSVADAVARRVAAAAGSVARALPPSSASAQAPAPGLAPVDPEDELVPSPSAPAPKGSGAEGSRGPARKGIMVRREVVLAAVRSGVRPSGAPVPATSDHPAGLQVYGLGGAGALRDGDIITRVGGAAPRSVEDVIGAVAGSYRTKSYVVSGEFWRDGEKWSAVVELPLPEGSEPRASTSSDRRTDRRLGAR